MISSGRTDAGVHARGQVINFMTASNIPVERWCLALNTRLPKDIVVLSAEEVPLEFHSRKSAKRKMYCYDYNQRDSPMFFTDDTNFIIYSPLDINAMSDALTCLVGEHDFTSFCTVRYG